MYLVLTTESNKQPEKEPIFPTEVIVQEYTEEKQENKKKERKLTPSGRTINAVGNVRKLIFRWVRRRLLRFSWSCCTSCHYYFCCFTKQKPPILAAKTPDPKSLSLRRNPVKIYENNTGEKDPHKNMLNQSLLLTNSNQYTTNHITVTRLLVEHKNNNPHVEAAHIDYFKCNKICNINKKM